MSYDAVCSDADQSFGYRARIEGRADGSLSFEAEVAAAIVAAVLPAVRAEAKVEFEAGLRLAKLGKKHHPEARDHLARATQPSACSRRSGRS